MTRLAVSTRGVGEPTFVLLHGLASTRRVFDALLPKLARKHRVIAYDQRGHGESEKPERAYALADFVSDLEEVLGQHGVSRPVLVGHSFGANVSLRHAVTHRRARGLVLVDGGILEMHAHLSWERARSDLLPTAEDPTDVERWIREGPPFLPNGPVQVEARRSIYEIVPGGPPRKRLTRDRHERTLRSLWAHDVEEDLAHVPCPTLLVVCEAPEHMEPNARWREQKARAAVRAAGLPRIEVRWFFDTLHDAPLHRPDELARAILDFAATLP